jgi:oligogalacturonide lyase
VDLKAGYVGFREIFEAHPLCRLVRIPTEGEHNEAEVLFEERNWIGHVNASPTRPNHLTFCHEGPWTRVGQRIWGIDTQTKKVWKIRSQSPGETVGHEYWMTDGRRIGYHGIGADGVAYCGSILHDGSDRIEIPFPHDSNHFHSNTPELIVADGPAKGLTPYVLLSKFDRERRTFDGPRVLCVHRGSRHTQHLHIHPRFTPDGKQVLYTSDPKGYGNLYLADVPPIDELPLLNEMKT